MVYLGRSKSVTFSDIVVRGAASSFFNATRWRGTSGSTTSRDRHHGSRRRRRGDHNWKSTRRRVRDSRLTGYGDSRALDQAGKSRSTRVTIRHRGYGNLTYGTHGLYLNGPGAIVEDSDVGDIKGGQCISPCAGALIRGNRLNHCMIGIGQLRRRPSWWELVCCL